MLKIHREHLDPLAPARGFVYGVVASLLWLAVVLIIVLSMEEKT